MSERIVLLYSGGLDSTTLLYQLVAEGADVIPLFVGYGQRHRNEEYMAACELAAEHQLIPLCAELPGVTHLFRNNALTGTMPLPVAGLTPGDTVVPGRNALLLSIANMLAEMRGALTIAIGCNADDAEVYVDCRGDFLQAMEAVIGRDIRADFLTLTKRAVVERGVSLGVPLERTWSCYAGGPAQCGRCDACVRRAVALEGVDIHPFATRVGGDDPPK